MYGIVALLVCILVAQNSLAMSISINPASIRKTGDDWMVRGGYTEKTVRVATKEENAVVNIYFENRQNPMNEWIALDPPERVFNLSNGDPRYITISIEPPEDTPNGQYDTSLIFTIKNPETFEGMTGATIDTAVAFIISITINDEEMRTCTVRSAGISDIEEGDSLLSRFLILNTGNIRLNPTILMEFWNQEGSEMVKTIEYESPQILPSVTEEILIEQASDDLDPGQYFVDVSVDECYYEDTLTFDLLESGTLSAEGQLIGISVPAWNNRSDIIELNPIFRNTGQKDVQARFKGKITLGGTIKKLIETQTVTVAPGKQVKMEAFFESDEPGRYEVSGRVFYDTKQTFEKTNRFNILDQYSVEEETDEDGFSLAFVFILIGAAAFTLLILIKKKKMRIKKVRHHH